MKKWTIVGQETGGGAHTYALRRTAVVKALELSEERGECVILFLWGTAVSIVGHASILKGGQNIVRDFSLNEERTATYMRHAVEEMDARSNHATRVALGFDRP
jgi:hypothetical protein